MPTEKHGKHPFQRKNRRDISLHNCAYRNNISTQIVIPSRKEAFIIEDEILPCIQWIRPLAARISSGPCYQMNYASLTLPVQIVTC